MNGYGKRELDEDAFGAKAGSIVSAFDAFRTSHPPARFLFLTPPPLQHASSRLLAR